MDYQVKLEARVAELEAQIQHLAELPFSDNLEEAYEERTVVRTLEDQLRERLELLDKFFPEREEDPAYWDRLTGRLY